MLWRSGWVSVFWLCHLYPSIGSWSSVVAGEPIEVDFSQPLVLLEVGVNLGDEIPAKLRRYLSPWMRRKSSLTPGDVIKSLVDGEGLDDVIKPPVLLISVGNTSTFEALRQAPWAEPPGPSR